MLFFRKQPGDDREGLLSGSVHGKVTFPILPMHRNLEVYAFTKENAGGP